MGKSTAQAQIIEELLESGVPPKHILRVQFDELPSMDRVQEPVLAIVDWFENQVLGQSINTVARAGQRAYLFLDEAQNLEGWDAQLKFLVDSTSITVVLTGSSALRIEAGRDSLAGRVSTVEAGALSLTEIGTLRGLDAPPPFLPDNGLQHLVEPDFWRELRAHGEDNSGFRDAAFHHFSECGGYPLAHRHREVEWNQLADQLNETVIQRVVQHDLRQGRHGRRRDASLLEAVFLVACRYAGQAPTTARIAEEIDTTLGFTGGVRQVSNYLGMLADALLIRLIPPLELRLKGKRGSPKLCLADHSLRASWLQERIPLAPRELASRLELTTFAGHIAESVFGTVASTVQGLDVAHFPERGMDREVDFVLTVGYRRIPVEIRYQRRIDPLRDTLGLRQFMEKAANNASFGVLITLDDTASVDDPRIATMPLSSFMLLR